VLLTFRNSGRLKMHFVHIVRRLPALSQFVPAASCSFLPGILSSASHFIRLSCDTYLALSL
jgi:hypothetical protein